MKLEAPWPPSLNRLWRTMVIGACASCRKRAHATLFKSQEYQDYSVALQLSMLEQEVQPIQGTPALIVTAHFYRPRKTGDLDNNLKAMLDVMGKGRVYGDDSQIVEIHAYRHDDEVRPRVELEVSELATNETAKQEALDLGGLPAAPPAKPVHLESPTLAQERRSLAKATQIPESLEKRLRRLARPATVSNR